MFTDFEIFLFVCVIVLILLPPKYDPAVRIKEWQIKNWGKRYE
jgi:hypothetical protein